MIHSHVDLRVSPLTAPLSPLSIASLSIPTRNFSDGGVSARLARGGPANHRGSFFDLSVNEHLEEGTDEYAQIISSSRTAKMKKWKSPTSNKMFDQNTASSWDSGKSFRRKPIPTFSEMVGEREDHDRGENEESLGFGNSFDTNSGGVTREIEWVDWLDEYRRMKEAKLRAGHSVAPPIPIQSQSLPTDSSLSNIIDHFILS